MKPFFETAVQARVFLAALPIGFLLGILLDVGGLLGKARILADIAALLTAGAGLVILSLLSRENGLQIYHLLAVFLGCLLYTAGIGRGIRLVYCKIKKLFCLWKKIEPSGRKK